MSDSSPFEKALSMLENRLERIKAESAGKLLRGGRVGLEKEGLRVATDGSLSQTDHPEALGSPLTHRWITTDYSEALLEFITPPFGDVTESLDYLRDVQTYVYERLQGEMLWGTSMPCVVGGESQIPIARYGTSNAGMMKHIYRVGLGYRYGRVMQVIAGLHFNYSVAEPLWDLLHQEEGGNVDRRVFVNQAYMGMVRNLQRFGWMVAYLFGASPAVCKTFFGGRPTDMPLFDEGTHYEPYATSLRMGDIGYQNQKEESVGIKACYDCVDTYVQSLTHAIETPAPLWEAIGVKVGDEWRQLNANILQIENEYYSTVRPKPLAEGMEKPTLALKRRGIQYVELRSPDLNAFDPLGIDPAQARFLESFMLFCLLVDSPKISGNEAREIDYNLQRTAHQGRKPGLSLAYNGRKFPLRSWAERILEAMGPLCELMDSDAADLSYGSALAEQKYKVDDPSATPSARMLTEMRANGESFHAFARRMSVTHQEYFKKQVLSEEFLARMDSEVHKSAEAQARMEADDRVSFDEFLANYFAQQ